MAEATKKLPHKYFSDQYDDEEVLMVFNKHPVVMRKGLIISSLGLLVGPIYVVIVSYLSPNNIPTTSAYLLILLAGFLFAALLFFPSWINWKFSLYIITDQRLIQITQKGLFKRSVVDLALTQIQMVNYSINGFQETLLGFGTIMVQTYVGDLTIHDVHHPAKIQKEILLILRERGIATNSYPNPNQPPTGLIEEDDNEDDDDDEEDSE